MLGWKKLGLLERHVTAQEDLAFGLGDQMQAGKAAMADFDSAAAVSAFDEKNSFELVV